MRCRITAPDPAQRTLVVPTWAVAGLVVLAAAVAPSAAQAAPVWLSATTLSPAGQAAGSQQVVSDAAGDATAVWSGNDGADVRVQASTRPAGGTWSAPISLSAAGHDGTAPAVAIDRAGNVTAVWIRSDGANTRAQTSSMTPGGTWSAPVNLSAAGTNATVPAVAVNAAGDAIAGWADDHGAIQLEISARDGASGAWQPAADVSGPGTPLTPQLAIDGAGNGSAVWAQSGPGTIGQRIQFSSSPPQGVWASPINLGDLGGPSESPDIAADSNGDLAAVWDRYDGSGYQLQARTYSAASGTWDAAVSLPSANASETGGVSAARVSINGSGEAVASWMRLPQVGLKRVEAATHVLGDVWSPTTAMSAPTATAANTQNAISDDGDAVVIWAATADGSQRVQASSLGADGVWAAPVNVTPAGVDSSAPSVALDGAGNGVAAWAQGDGTTNAVQASGLDNVGPQLTSIRIPSTTTVGATASFAAAVVDAWSGIGSVSWSFGDGGSAGAAAASHVYAAAGTYDVAFTAIDGAGNATTQSGRITVAPAPPTPTPASTPSQTAPASTTPLIKGGAESPTINPATVLPLDAAGNRVPAAMTKAANTLTFFLDLARTGKTCPAPRAVATTLRMTIGKKTTSAKLLKRRFTVAPVASRKVCAARGVLTLKAPPKAAAKLRLVFKSKATKTKSIRVVWS